MYEQAPESSSVLRRVLGLAFGFLIIAVIVWLLVWLIFFRHHNAGNTSIDKGLQTQSPKHSGASSGGSSTGSNGTNTQSGDTDQTSSSTTPTQLANTGAGNVIAPSAAAAVIGTGLYYIRLRRKLTA